ncbi:Glu-tRNA(Gln) amidotransferase GatDE subunit E [archaeon]|nr:Glu-tRNA(Gln) amidotransferase GatDE subunit E [archaeon]
MQDLGLKCGIEIHQQLSGKKLFCNCPTQLRDDDPHFTVSRKIRAAAGEGGKTDVAAAQEQQRDKTFVYEGYKDTTCLVEVDEEPPHSVNEDALHTVLQFVKMVRSTPSPIVQMMRKTVADGSNTSGFQRTGLISRGGKIETSEGDVRIDNISLEEDAGKIIAEVGDIKTYRLDRLGVPLIEIGTAPDITTPQQCQEAARQIGMLLRSLPGVKRGLGTIRQDVNVSIKGGTRVEIKGAQDLKGIPQLVELEMKRQHELLQIKKELETVQLHAMRTMDVTSFFKKTDAKRVKEAVENGYVIMGMKLNDFVGLIGKELQPGYRVGTEFAGRAKIIAGVGGIFHSDELPNYGISEKEVELVRKKLECDRTDAFVLVVAEAWRCKIALHAVYGRAKELFTGVPSEVRKAQQDGTSTYMRPMPGAARMYPETDVPLLYPDMSEIELPELLDAKIKRFQEEYNLSADLAAFVVKNANSSLFEEIVGKYPTQKAAFIADVMTSMLVEIRRKYKIDTSQINDDHFREFFLYLDEGKIHKDIALDVLMDMAQGKFDISKYESLSTEDLHAVIKEIVEKNKGAPMGALMGMCMKKLAGKASGQVISAELKKLI